MIESIILTNFQTHKHLEVSFSPLITTIVGPTESGKTTIIRALRSICLNKTSKKNITHGKDRARLILKVNGHKIIRRIGTNNIYSLDGKEYKAFAKVVPDDIQSLLKICPINFQLQLDLHYWLSKTPGELAKELNKIVNLEVIDGSQYYLSSQIRKASSEKEITKSRLRTAKKNKKELAWVKQANAELQELEQRQQQCIVKQHRIASNELLLSEARKYRFEVQNSLQKTTELQKLVSKASKAEDLSHRVTVLEKLILAGFNQREQICQLREEIERLEKELKEKIGRNCPLCGKRIEP